MPECINLLLWFDPAHDILETQHANTCTLPNLWETYLQRYFLREKRNKSFHRGKLKRALR